MEPQKTGLPECGEVQIVQRKNGKWDLWKYQYHSSPCSVSGMPTPGYCKWERLNFLGYKTKEAAEAAMAVAKQEIAEYYRRLHEKLFPPPGDPWDVKGR